MFTIPLKFGDLFQDSGLSRFHGWKLRTHTRSIWISSSSFHIKGPPPLPPPFMCLVAERRVDSCVCEARSISHNLVALSPFPRFEGKTREHTWQYPYVLRCFVVVVISHMVWRDGSNVPIGSRDRYSFLSSLLCLAMWVGPASKIPRGECLQLVCGDQLEHSSTS